jgi:hypothetical protein
MIVAWVLFPLVLLAVCLGCGLGVERICGWRLPGTVILSIGLALVIVAATLMTYRASTAPYTTALVVVLALAGYAGGMGRLRLLRPDPWALAVAVGVFAVMAAPVVLSGNASFLGYFILNDTAVHFALIDQLLAHGRDLSVVPPSSYQAVLQSYVSTDYPIGSQVALGALRPLVGQDIAWIFQPYLATILSFGALALYELLGGVVRSRALRATCAFVAAQSGLLYAYYLEASIKELATTWIITLTVVMVVLTLRERLTLRRIVPLALVAVAGFDVLELAIAPWLGIPLAVFAVLAGWRSRHVIATASKGRLVLASAVSLALLAAIASPIIASARTFFDVASGVLTENGQLGNLVTPLVRWQMLGIWPSGDFRFPVVAHYRIVYALLGIALLSAMLGTVWLVRRRAAGPLLMLVSGTIATVYLFGRASPYAEGKVMAIFSVTVVLTAMLGAAALHDAGRRLEAWLLAALLAGGVLWTNVEAYRGASVAPRARLQELGSIGARFSGQGPAFYNLADEFAIHFLRGVAPADPALSPPMPRPGLPPRAPSELRAPWDPDELQEAYVQGFRLLVLNRSPRTSRPPADFQLAYRGRYYDVWRRTASPQVLEHLALGNGLEPTSVPSCTTVVRLAARARAEHARLAYATRAPAAALVPTQALRPDNWGEVSGDPYTLIPRQEAGMISGGVRVSAPGLYDVWLQGAFSDRLTVRVDGREVGTASDQMGTPDQVVPIARVYLRAGEHAVSVAVPTAGLAPGGTLVNQTVGPLMLAPAAEPEPVAQIAPAQARTLCGRSLDWIEIVRP